MEKQNLTPEDIKVGETYNVRVTVALIGDSVIHCSIGGTTINFWKTAVSAFSPVSPANGIKNTETAPKYDQNRKFRKGDIVEPRKGREVYACEWEDCCFHKMDGKYEVQVDESEGHVSVIDKKTGIDCYVSAFALELVAPVEALEPYYIVDDDLDADFSFFAIQNRNSLMAHDLEEEVARFVYGTEYTADKETVRKRAEAERDRLNAEYRKGQE